MKTYLQLQAHNSPEYQDKKESRGHKPRLHVRKGGSPIAGSPFAMTAANSEDFTNGRIYEVNVSNLAEGSDYTYLFEAQDIDGLLATGEGTILQPGPLVTDQSSLEQDSLALVALYNNTDGSNWTNNANWLSNSVFISL